MTKIIVGTRNPGKYREILEIMGRLPVEFVSLIDLPEIPEVKEDGTTIEQNSIKKLRTIFNATGIPTLADDTGLEVYHLDMEPGVYSARYAGEHASYDENNMKLLSALRGVNAELRRARFRCVASFTDGIIEHTAEGICEGAIVTEPKGTGGFGYDPLFVPDGFDQTFAELPTSVRNKISHRAVAFRAMFDFVKAINPTLQTHIV